MGDDRKPPADLKLSDSDARHVLERAARIDADRGLSVSDLTEAAHEAGISEQAVMQAVGELLEARQLTTAAVPDDATVTAPGRIKSLMRATAFGLLFVSGLLVIYAILRLFP